MAILIFGDSFSEAAENHYYNGITDYSWPQLLEQEVDEKIINFSKGSTGPYYSMSKLYEYIENNDLKIDDKIIMMLSSQYRIPFSFVNILRSQELADFYSEERECDEKYFNEISYDLLLVYNTLKNEIDLINYKNISFIKSLTITKKIKAIVFLCYSHYGYFTYEENYIDHYIKKFNFFELNDEKFKLYDKPLDFISLEENIPRINNDVSDNYKPNHLDWYNHKILKNIILNFFYDKKYDDKFKKNFIKVNRDLGLKPYLYD